MLNVLLITASHADAVREVRGELEEIKGQLREAQVEGVRIRRVDAENPESLAKILAQHNFDVIHVNGRHLPEKGPEQGQSWATNVQPLLDSTSGDQGEGKTHPVVILDACSAHQAARILLTSFPCLLELPAKIDRASALSFLATLYETLTRGHSLQTGFWLGCCKMQTTEEAASFPRISSAPGFDPRTQSYGCQPAVKLPIPTVNKFFDEYSSLCNEIKEKIFKPLIEQYESLIAKVYAGDGPVPIEQEKEFSNDFAYLAIAIYRGPRALELQRERFDKYEDPSRQYANLYEWTVDTEVGDANLENWMKEEARKHFHDHDALFREATGSADWKKLYVPSRCDELARVFCDRDMRFADDAGYNFSLLMKELYVGYQTKLNLEGTPGPP
jgi:hypothetical protein